MLGVNRSLSAPSHVKWVVRDSHWYLATGFALNTSPREKSMTGYLGECRGVSELVLLPFLLTMDGTMLELSLTAR